MKMRSEIHRYPYHLSCKAPLCYATTKLCEAVNNTITSALSQQREGSTDDRAR